MITVIFGGVGGDGGNLGESIGCGTSVEISANNVREMIEQLGKLCPNAKNFLIYEHLAWRINAPFLIKLNDRPLYPKRDVHKAQFEDGDVVLVVSPSGGVGRDERELMQELIERKRAKSEGNSTS